MKTNPNMVEDLVRLRDEMDALAFDANGVVLSSTHAAFFYKLNSVLYRGYPRRSAVAPEEYAHE